MSGVVVEAAWAFLLCLLSKDKKHLYTPQLNTFTVNIANEGLKTEFHEPIPKSKIPKFFETLAVSRDHYPPLRDKANSSCSS